MNGDNEKFEMLAKTLYGFEGILAKEIKELGGEDVKTANRVVMFKGGHDVLYRTNYRSRLALKILKPLLEFNAADDKELYKKTMDLDWSNIMGINQTFAVDPVVNSPKFTHSHYVALKVKDAIADRFRKEMGRRPNVNPENPDIKINVHISNTRVSLSLDSSGSSLHKRGYRKKHGYASLNEVLAAGLISLSGWDRQMPFYDLMCGSGTLPIEAALMANNIPPGAFHRDYLFTNWPEFDEGLFRKIKEEVKAVKNKEVFIYGSDSLSEQVNIARLNARNAGLGDLIRIEKRELKATTACFGKGVVIMNPPYGERIMPDRLEELYSDIGDHLKKEYQGCRAFIFSAKPELLKRIGLHPRSRIELYNAELKSMLYEYELYPGSRKLH